MTKGSKAIVRFFQERICPRCKNDMGPYPSSIYETHSHDCATCGAKLVRNDAKQALYCAAALVPLFSLWLLSPIGMIAALIPGVALAYRLGARTGYRLHNPDAALPSASVQQDDSTED